MGRPAIKRDPADAETELASHVGPQMRREDDDTVLAGNNGPEFARREDTETVMASNTGPTFAKRDDETEKGNAVGPRFTNNPN